MASYNISIEDVIIENKNFRGLETSNNTAGNRNFSVRIRPDQEISFDVYDNGRVERYVGTVQDLIDQGWNIRPHNSYNPSTESYEPDGDYKLSSVKVSFKNEKYRPNLKYYPNRETKSFIFLNEDHLSPGGKYGDLIDDRGSFDYCNVCIHGYNDKPGHVSCFVKDMVIIGRPTIFDQWGYGDDYGDDAME